MPWRYILGRVTLVQTTTQKTSVHRGTSTKTKRGTHNSTFNSTERMFEDHTDIKDTAPKTHPWYLAWQVGGSVEQVTTTS